MFRLNSWTRWFAEVPATILPYTYPENSFFSLPDFETMMSYKVVVTTCRDADMLVQARLTNESLMHLAQKTISAVAPQLSKSVNPKQLIHWTALLLDEAAQAIEPEALVPLSVVNPVFSMAATGAVSTEWSHPVPQVVMAGDECQLGPLLSLKSATPLATSLFARLFARPLYSAHPLSRANGSRGLTSAMLPILRPPFTNLIRNYRSHPAILTVPSVLFYADSLITECNMLSDAVRTWPGWQDADAFGGRSVAVANIDSGDAYRANGRGRNLSCWPVLFVNNSGADTLESILAGRRAGGLFNVNEAFVALRIVQSLLRHRIPGPPTERAHGDLPSTQVNGYVSEAMTNNDSIQPGEIVVMSPFRAQVNYLRTTFREVGLYKVNIGPLEAFQGLESRIVILCTTRTRLGTVDQGRDRFVREDQSKGLGVIGERKKFNVAITRAKEGLIVIGDKECLTCTKDEAWEEFLAFCERNESDRSASKFSQQLPVSYSQRQGRLERALRQKDNWTRNGRETDRHESSRNGLKGNRPSLDEDMFRDGLRIADEMSNNADNNLMYGADHEEIGTHGNHEHPEDSSVKNARRLSAHNVKPELSRGDKLHTTIRPGNDESSTTYIPSTAKAAGAHTETLTAPSSAGARAPGGGTHTHTPVSREALRGVQFGSFQVPVPTKTGEHIARAAEYRDPRRSEKGKHFDRDLEAEVEGHERADCATQ
jgi:helicase MOV-10